MRVKLCEKYKLEREEICKRLIDILKLDANGTFLLCDFDADIEKQTAILNMKEEIQKYFACSEISSFKNNNSLNCKRPYLNIVRGILRKQGYTFDNEDIELKMDNNIYKRTMRYKIFRNN